MTKDHEHRINLRLPAEIFEAMDRLRKAGAGKVSRNTWIAMAIEEKIERDSHKGAGGECVDA
ncbi:hypothetical protein TSH58p_30155 (plasmid) [Azospirillum sp. TSH58]|nr:hypothetical protein TSH58p_29995 [Azospirillum sp. TSH58]AWJ87777.1 hypothetical protein TSH58p_30155 [Azospirillum sp. TSH58]